MSVPSSRPASHADISCRLVALLAFLLGAGILVFVFVTALHLFQAPVPGRELLLLGVMTLVGSLLASKGAHLYFSALYQTGQLPEPSEAAPQQVKPETMQAD